jgi:hypothetical protein
LPEYWEVPEIAFSTWREVPAEPQQKLIDKVKKRLAEEGIPDRNKDTIERAIRWRMAQVIKSKMSKQACKLQDMQNL